MQPMKKISVIIPVFNEQKTIGQILVKVVRQKIYGFSKEIIIVNDGSTDRTSEEIDKFTTKHTSEKIKILSLAKNTGKGAAVIRGLKNATGDIALIQDADLEYDPKYYSLLLSPLISGKYKVAYGSRLRLMKLRFWGRYKTQFISHYFANRFLSFLTSILYKTKLTDMETGYKSFTKEVYKNLDLENSGFAIEPEITVKILRLGYQIKEVDISTKPRSYVEGKKITWRDGIIAIIVLLKYWQKKGKEKVVSFNADKIR